MPSASSHLKLKDMENLVLNAEAKINQKEYEIFYGSQGIYRKVLPERFRKTSDAIARLDVLCSFALVSERNGYTRPAVNESMEISIVKGRHPVIEQTSENGLFISNDVGILMTEIRVCCS